VKLVGESSTFPIKLRMALKGSTKHAVPVLTESAKRFEARSAKRDAIWQVPYNLACFWALATSDPDSEEGNNAFRLLDDARMSRGSWQMTAAWLQADVDLESLRFDDRFDQLLARLPPAADPVDLRDPGTRSPSQADQISTGS
jgi:hypothetical protein